MRLVFFPPLVGALLFCLLPVSGSQTDSGCLYADTHFSAGTQRVNGGHCQVCHSDSSWGDLPAGSCPDCTSNKKNLQSPSNSAGANPNRKKIQTNVCKDERGRT